jgi:hypothetical protein
MHYDNKLVCSFPHSVIDLVYFLAVFPCVVINSITHTIVSSSCFRTILCKKRKKMGNGLQSGSLSLGYLSTERSMVSLQQIDFV